MSTGAQITWDDEEQKKGAPIKQAAAPTGIQWDTPQEPEKEGVLGGMWNEAKSYFPSTLGEFGKSLLTGPINPVGFVASQLGNVLKAPEQYQKRISEGRSPLYSGLATAAETSGIVNPQGQEEAAKRGDVGGVVGHAAVPALMALAGPLAHEVAPEVSEAWNQFREPGRIESGQARIGEALRTPPGKGGQRASAMENDIQTVSPDLAKIQRETPLASKGPERFVELADNISDYKNQLWDEGHKQVVERHAQMPFDNKAVLQKTLGEILPEDDSAQAKLATQWANREISKLGTLGSADTKIRLLNQEIRSLPEKYGPVGVRVRQAAVKAIRQQLDDQLVQSGEEGVKDVNRRWGALDNMENRLRERAPVEAQKAARNPIVPDWFHLYAFSHGGIPAIGAGLRIGKMFLPEDATRLGRGLSSLGKTSLEPAPQGSAAKWRQTLGNRP